MKIGFLPLYIALYDESGSKSRDRLEPFYETLACAFEQKGVEVVRSPFCRLAPEFAAAVSAFEKAGADAIVTWHAAYSPSLESIDAIAGTALPVIVLDTTETYDFSPAQDPGEISYCHGIHGVMDFCNMLKRRNKPYAIAAGHYPTSDVIDDAVEYLKAAVSARALSGSRVGRIGRSFPGMGDFLISDRELLTRFGVEAVTASGDELRELRESITEAEIDEELVHDNENAVRLNDFTEESHRRTVRNGLAVRRWLKNYGLEAFTVSFLDITPACGLEIMPFMEACKALARGIGYAGEGDVLTAALTGALLQGFKAATFVEIFCPDWKGGTLFLSHMGEVNYALTDGPIELKEINFNYGDAKKPVVGYARYRKGSAVFMNLFDSPEGYKLLVAPVTMEEPEGEDAFVGNMRGWMRPNMPTADFLRRISEEGVTHHSALVYDTTPEAVAYFGRLLGLPVICL